MKLKTKKGWADRRLDKKTLRGKPVDPNAEHLVGCSLERDEVVHGRTLDRYRSHSDIRRELGDENPYNERPGDVCGFVTNTGRFVGRREGSVIAVLAGQAPPMYEDTQIMSCDIAWRTK